jgi:predicted porin
MREIYVKHFKSPSRRAVALAGAAFALGLCGNAHAQSATPAPAPDDSLTFHGVTLSGIVDLGLQYDNHGARESDYFPAGTNEFASKQNNGSITTITPSNLSQSKLTLSGKEPIGDEFYGVFKLESFFNPQAGTLSNALKSLTLNNGISPATAQTQGADSSIAGQAFNSAAFVGIGSKHYGTITFGRQTSLLADGVSSYDPMAGGQAFSIIGYSGTYGGGGDTQDKRFDDSIKYTITIMDHFRLGALYKFSQTGGEANTAASFQIGASAANASIDFYYEKVKSAVSASSLSAAQVTALATTCPGCEVGTTLAATISDNETYAVMAAYKLKRIRLSGGYEHIEYKNPTDPLVGGTGAAYNDIGGYTIPYALMNQTAYVNPKKLDTVWVGAQVAVTSKLALWVSYENIHQNSYGSASAVAACATNAASSGCSGDLQALSAVAIYGLNKHFDLYAGLMASNVTNGFASGFVQFEEIDPTAGVRLKF